jgi:hypothetical protein
MRAIRRGVVKTAALAGVVVFAFAGCGGDDDDASGGGTVSEAEFQKQADELCRKFQDDVDAKTEEFMSTLDENSTPEEIGAVFVDEILPLFRQQIDELQDLPTPDQNAQEYEDLFNDLEDAADNLEQMAKDDPEALFTSEEDPFADLDQRAQELGLEDCGSSDEG